LLSDFFELLRLRIKAPTGRSIIFFRDVVVKVYESLDEGTYEYNLLQKIKSFKTEKFRVPSAIKFVRGLNSKSAIIMEKVKGMKLDDVIVSYLLFNKKESIKIFYCLGTAVKELHQLGMRGIKTYCLPTSIYELTREIANLIIQLDVLGLINKKDYEQILHLIKKKANVNFSLFSKGFIHGELYFTHVLLSNEKPVLIDFHRACKGPIYYDLAMFLLSMHSSFLYSKFRKKLDRLYDAFLRGYFGRVDENLFTSIVIAEVYLVLRETIAGLRNLKREKSLRGRLLTKIRIKKYIKVLNILTKDLRIRLSLC